MAGTMAQKYSRLILSIVVLVLCVTTTIAFAPVSPTGIIKERISTAAKTSISRSTTASCTSTTCLSERRWNFNEGQSPWGMKQNAEKWNGRVAQVCFVVPDQFWMGLELNQPINEESMQYDSKLVVFTHYLRLFNLTQYFSTGIPKKNINFSYIV